MVGARIHAPGKRGPSWRYSNTGGASAASRHRPTQKQGLQGLRFAPGNGYSPSLEIQKRSPLFYLVLARVCGDLRGKKPQNGHPARTENGDRGLVHPCHRCLSARQCHTFTVTQRQKLFGRISASSASTVYAKKQPSNRNSTAGTFAKPVRKIVLEWNLGVINCRIENSNSST